MKFIGSFVALAIAFGPKVNAQTSDDMGPVAFLWPPDRAWGAAQDNTPPCGSQAGVTNRTEFPLSKSTRDYKKVLLEHCQHCTHSKWSSLARDPG